MEVLQYLWLGQIRNLRYMTALEDKVFDLTYNEITSITSNFNLLGQKLNLLGQKLKGDVQVLEKKLKEQDVEMFNLKAETEFLWMWVKCLIFLVLCLVLERLCVYVY